ncbi:TraR/DksA C4-type zinc finger protein [Hoeflea alexandrii]|uniref:TraR/DksA C4-type zinc finger protein n=1 Tax=Hoeflea alexandrii TaxID=288436 RepID=UPI0035CF152A
MSGTDFMIEQAEARVAVEVSYRIEAVSGLVAQPGRECCIDCEEPISEARRSAAPFARRCFECQSARENARP